MIKAWMKQLPEELKPEFAEFFAEYDDYKLSAPKDMAPQQILNTFIMNQLIGIRYEIKKLTKEKTSVENNEKQS